MNHSDLAVPAAGPLGESWRKSSFSGTGNCVEVRVAGSAVLVRDTKDRSGPELRFTLDEWAALVAGVKNGEFEARRSAAR